MINTPYNPLDFGQTYSSGMRGSQQRRPAPKVPVPNANAPNAYEVQPQNND